MMYVVSYKLSSKRDMSALFNEFQKPPSGWAHHLDDTWFVATQETAEQLFNRVSPFFDSRDFYVIVKVWASPNDIAAAQGLMPKTFWDWFNDPGNHR